MIKGLDSLPYSTIDSRTNFLYSFGKNYKKITEYLEEKNIKYEDHVLDLLPLGHLPKINVKLRDYQKEAIEYWRKEKRGSIVLPTGAGKTIVGLKIIEMVNSPTLIIVPTLDLVKQWTKILSQSFNPICLSESNSNPLMFQVDEDKKIKKHFIEKFCKLQTQQ